MKGFAESSIVMASTIKNLQGAGDLSSAAGLCLVAGPSVQMTAYNLRFERQTARCLPARDIFAYSPHFLP